ncbi:MAG: helix-turn-helix domain-containing protein [Syntrophales bacterium LBB04]|nr:helix-turn-helix domain-containing protein [Syntrophales bacterium LBB04]
MTKGRYITIQHAAERISATDRHIYALIQEGTLKAIRIGPRALRVSERSLEEFIDSRQVAPGSLLEDPESPSPPEALRTAPRSRWMTK